MKNFLLSINESALNDEEKKIVESQLEVLRNLGFSVEDISDNEQKEEETIVQDKTNAASYLVINYKPYEKGGMTKEEVMDTYDLTEAKFAAAVEDEGIKFVMELTEC